MEQKNNGKFRLRLNLFDCIVIFAAVLVGGVLLWSKMQPADTADAPEAEQIRYTLCLYKVADGIGALVNPGDTLLDSAQNIELGQVADVRVEKATGVTLNQITGVYSKREIPGYEDVYLVVESTAVMEENRIQVGEGREIRVGDVVYVKGPGYMASSTVYAIERGE